MPKISAVMALYNTPYDLLKATINSILNQTFKDFELIIVDDASTMEYKKFLSDFNDERIKYHKQTKNAGPGPARNIGIKLAQGEFIAITDSDDIYMPERFERQLDFLKNNPEISLIGCTFRFSNRKKNSYVPIGDNDIRTFMLFNSPLNNSTIMFRKDVFAEKNLYYFEEINFAEDYGLWINAMFAGVKMANMPDFLMIYTRRPGQLSKARIQKQIAILKKLYKKMFVKLGFEPTQKELDLHYSIYTEKFKNIHSAEQINNWFNKILDANKKSGFFDEASLITMRDNLVSKFEKKKRLLFKLKIGNYNYCIDRHFKFFSEERE